MKIKFKANIVEYSEEIGGDLIQVSFDEKDHDDILENPYKYVSIAVNYEFPPCEPSIEWYDGVEFGGEDKIESFEITDQTFKLHLPENVSFDITFETNETKLKNIKKFLSSICN